MFDIKRLSTFRYQWSLTVLDGTFANMTILI